MAVGHRQWNFLRMRRALSGGEWVGCLLGIYCVVGRGVVCPGGDWLAVDRLDQGVDLAGDGSC